jgi:integrase
MTLRKSQRLDFDAALVLAAQPVEVENITFAELCAAYVAVAYDDADYRLRKWASGLGSLAAWSVEREQLQHCAEAMLAAGYKASTINRDVAQIGTIFKWAKKKRMAPPGFRSPTADFEWLDEPERIIHANEREIARLLAGSFASKDRRFAAFVHLLNDSGARRGEIEERRWKDVDLEAGTILCQFTKTDRPRVLFFGPTTAALMQRTWPRREPEMLLFEGRMPGVPINYRAAWRTLAKGIGRPDLHMHDLRHVAAQRLLKGGITVGVASQILGHSSSILQRRYGHLETATLKQAALSVLGR